MSHWTDEYLEMVEDCEKREERLTDWERKFIDSIRKQLEQERLLSAKQMQALDNIWERVTAKG
jgi:hypothetical protein